MVYVEYFIMGSLVMILILAFVIVLLFGVFWVNNPPPKKNLNKDRKPDHPKSNLKPVPTKRWEK
jgi:hypothetical protein